MPIPNLDRQLSDKILEVIEGSLSDKFGKDVTHVIFYNFSLETALSKEDIPGNSEKFEQTLDKLFGHGASLPKTTIVKRLVQSFELDRPNGGSIGISDASIRDTILQVWRSKQRKLIE